MISSQQKQVKEVVFLVLGNFDDLGSDVLVGNVEQGAGHEVVALELEVLNSKSKSS